MTKNQIVLIGAGLFIIVSLALLFYFGSQKPESELSGNLVFWGVFDSPRIMDEIITAYKKQHPKVEIQYRQLPSETYERDLLNALAGTAPPDLFMFHNTWLPKHFDKAAAFLDSEITLTNLRDLFPRVVEQDFAPDGFIYALPLYIDTLAMFYNQEFLDNKGIAIVPKTWEDFETVLPKLRELDNFGRIQKAAAAIGGSNKSINRATDLLNLIFLQAGTQMTAPDFSRATFSAGQGSSALNFYLKFANPLSQFYTWSDGVTYSLDSFAAGETAIMFNYSHQIAFLKEKNPFLNFRVAPMLQPRDRTTDVNFANYWGVAALAKSPQQAVAKNFILFLTANPTISQQYLTATGKPPALRMLINRYQSDPQLGIFANQALTARSWPQVDNVAVENALSGMIESILAGRSPADRALREAENAITNLMERKR
ncbi:MAG: extracellular solute-binding protein [Candidatus Harrisonbacteria bacterium]|nr:extracellular solute-binding protein [Candidatus Harrisonbacteria bacterium]